MPALPPLLGLSDPDDARSAARDVLDGSKYQERQLPRPFKGVLEWIADRLRPVVDALEAVFGPVIEAILALPGGRFILAAIVAGLVAVPIAWLVSRRSRSAVAGASGGGGLVDLSADPDALDREAAAAEDAGRYDAAVRLRYEAGLLRLVRGGRLELRPDTTAGAAARQIDHPAMDVLTADFEQVVYGGRDATADDAERARSAWGEVVGAGARR